MTTQQQQHQQQQQQQRQALSALPDDGLSQGLVADGEGGWAIVAERRPPGRFVRFLWWLLRLDQTVKLTQELHQGVISHKNGLNNLYPVASRSQRDLAEVGRQMQYLVDTVGECVERVQYYEAQVPAIRRAKVLYDAAQAEKVTAREEFARRGEARRRREAIQRQGPNGVFVPPADATEDATEDATNDP